MASNQPSTSSVAQEYTVRVPKTSNKKYAVMRFNASNNVDFTKCGPAKIERENNLKEYKIANDLETMPKFGAGSEFGREQKEEARRKKYGIHIKKYNPDDQPWLLKLGSGKQARKFKGNKEGGISDNASYYIFTQCPDGAFEAHPVEEWYNFSPQIKYKYLNSDEAEEHFSRRDKTLNYFSIMLKKRLKNEDISEADLDEGEKGKGKSKRKNFMLTEMDDWANFSDSDSHDSDEEDKADDDDEDKPKNAKNTKDVKQKGKKKKQDSDEEAVEESDDGDEEGREVDYMTDTDSDDAEMYNQEARDNVDKYEEKGVEDEDGLRNLMDSEEEEEEEKKEDEEAEDEGKEGKTGKEEKPKKDAESDSDSSSSSDSDSDPEKETGILSSALFMQKSEKKSGKGSSSNSRSNTPTPGSADSEDKSTAKKRKAESENPVAKKPRTESSVISKYTTSSSSTDGINEEAVRRYLMRKPMTTKDLLQKFKSKKTGLTKNQLVATVAQILKRLNPDKTTIKEKMYLSIKKTE